MEQVAQLKCSRCQCFPSALIAVPSLIVPWHFALRDRLTMMENQNKNIWILLTRRIRRAHCSASDNTHSRPSRKTFHPQTRRDKLSQNEKNTNHTYLLNLTGAIEALLMKILVQSLQISAFNALEAARAFGQIRLLVADDTIRFVVYFRFFSERFFSMHFL